MILPKMISPIDWAASLVIDFPDIDIPFLRDETNWKEWGELLKQVPSFSDIPTTYGYNNFSDWSDAVFFIKGSVVA